VLAVDLEYTLRAGLFQGPAGDAVGEVQGTCAGLFLPRMPLDEERLADVGKVELAVELHGGPDLPGLDSSVIRGRLLHEMRLSPILEVELQIVENSGPVSFSNWSGWRSLKLDVENPYREPFSVYVRTSDLPDYAPDETYTGGRFDGYVMGLWGRLRHRS
jgi:hypothetical protein